MASEEIRPLLRKGIAEIGMRFFPLSEEEVKDTYGLQKLTKLSANTNPLGPSPKVIESIRNAAERISLYPDGKASKIREAIARRRKVEISQVIAGNGSAELITCIGETFIDEGDECILPAGTYKPFQNVTRAMGGICVMSPLKEFRIDLEDIANKVNVKTKLIVLVNPNNPTGDILRMREVKAFLKQIERHTIVVFDEAYGEYVEEPDYPDTVEFVAQGHKVIALRTFSKAYGMAGLRLGYAISNADIIGYVQTVRQVFNVNALAQIAAVEALNDVNHLKRSIQLVWDEKKYYYRQMEVLGLRYLPTSSNFLLVQVSVDDMALCETLIRRGVMITPGTPLGFKGFVRISIGTREENERVVHCLGQCLSEMT